jgi:hypothetical protein
MAEIKTSIDRNNVQPDDALVALVGSAMLASATSRLVASMPDQTQWPMIMMRAMIYLMDMGEEHGAEDGVSVRKLRDLCELHIKRQLS